MRNYLNKGMLALIGLSIIYACSKDENSEPETPQISNVSFTVVASGDGNIVT
jgi:predicted component of type VI protein secretion system